MYNLPIEPLARFANRKVALKRPHEIAHFSYDDEHKYRADDSSLRYYYTPPLGVSLAEGFGTFKKLNDDEDEHLDGLLRAIMEKEKREEKTVDAGLITWRGMMTKILTAPYNNFDGFEMNATCFQGTVFIEENHEFKLKSRAEETKRPRYTPSTSASPDMMTFWGYKFETLCTLPQPWGETSREYIENREHAHVSNLTQFCSIAQTGFGDVKIVIGGEVDAIWDAPVQPSSPSEPVRPNYVELKTTAAHTEPHHSTEKVMIGFERKMQRMWAQSFLLGVPRIMVGVRSNDARGTLLEVREYETTKIPAMVKEQGLGSWDRGVCLGWAAEWVDWILHHVRGGGVWRIRRRPRSREIQLEKVEESGTGDILPRDFIEWRTQLGQG